jgi:Fe2+ or Zn2+ uptake regulation protein
MPKPDYESMTLEELEIVRQDLQNKRLEVAAEQDEVVAIIQKKGAAIGAQQKYDALTDSEKKALHQILSISGIKSEEKMGRP